MSPELWVLIGTLAIAGAALAGHLLATRQQGRQTKTTDAQAIIDQLQEIAKDAEDKHREDMQALRSELAELKGRVTRMESRELTLQDYVADLRHHIDQGKGPPPPPWPESLIHRT